MIMSRQYGQSQIEFLVSLAFLLPFAIMLPTLANMLLLQTEAHKASRHIAWERTAYATQDLKTSDELSDEVEQRFLRYSSMGFGDTASVSTQTAWRDWNTLDTMVEYGRGVAMQVDASRSATASKVNTSSWLAGRGGRQDPNSAIQLNTLQSGQLTIPLKSDISILQTSRPVNAWMGEPDPMNQPSIPTDPVSEEQGYYLKSASALVADGWVPGNEKVFHDRVAGIGSSKRGFLGAYQNTPITRTMSSVFIELKDHLYVDTPGTTSAFDMVDPNQSTTLPSGLKQY